LTFEHATRYLYFPMVGFSVWFAFLAGTVGRAAVSSASRLGLGLAFVYLLGLNLLSTSFHYQRYQNYQRDHPESSFSKQVLDLFRREGGGFEGGQRA
jgi:hypothetical protein